MVRALPVKEMRVPSLSGSGATENNWIGDEEGLCLLRAYSLVGEINIKLHLFSAQAIMDV